MHCIRETTNQSYLYVIPTNTLCDFLSIRLNALKSLHHQLFLQSSLRNANRSLFGYLVIYSVFSGLFSRPDDWSTYRNVSRFLWRYNNPGSHLLLFSRALHYYHNHEIWAFIHTIPREEILGAFSSSVASKITRAFDLLDDIDINEESPNANLDPEDDVYTIFREPALSNENMLLVEVEDTFNALYVKHPTRDAKPFRVAIEMFKNLGLVEECARWLVKFWCQEVEQIKSGVKAIKFNPSQKLSFRNWNTLEAFEQAFIPVNAYKN
jgi:hypothetical protein